MARSRKDRVFDALSPQEEDSAIFKTRHAVNWSQHWKVQKASRGIRDLQGELFEKVEKRELLEGIFGRDGGLKQVRSKFWSLLISLLVSSTIASLAAGKIVEKIFEIWYWRGFLSLLFITSVASFLYTLYRTYIDLYPRAAWLYWWKVRKEEREPINSIEAIEHLIYLFNKSSITELSGAFSDMYHYNKYREEAVKYRDWLEKNTQKDSIHSQEVLDMFKDRFDAVESIFQKLERKEEEILTQAKKLSAKTFPSHKKEMVRIERSISELVSEESGNIENLLVQPQEKKSEIEEEIITSVKTLHEMFSTALRICRNIHHEKWKKRDDDSVTRMSTKSLTRIQKMELTEDDEVKEEEDISNEK
ncbi:MAG: hypothetical protein WD335_00635 [Candidatus Paceibacterota bacterium]